MHISRIAALLLALAVLALHGCASLEPEAEPDWESGATVGALADTDARADGSRLVVGNRRSVLLLDGHDGSAIGAVGPESVLDALQVRIQAQNAPLAFNLRPESSNMLLLDEADLLLIFDYEGTREQITALNAETGEQIWKKSDLHYSIQQYEETIRQAASALGREVAASLGGSVSGETMGSRRDRQRHFARGLAAPVDGGDAILFKTFSGLVKLDAASGQELWHEENFHGPGILAVEELPGGDYLVLSRGRDMNRLQAATAYELARISPNGQLHWVTEHAGEHTRGMQVAGDRAIVQGEPVEVFDLASGERLWTTPEGWAVEDGGSDPRFMPEPDVLITETALYQASHIHGEDDTFVTFGHPHQVRSFDTDTGEERWASEVTGTYFGDLHKVGDQLVVWGTGEFFNEEGSGGAAGLDRDTGEVLWRTPEMETPGMMSWAPWVVEPVYDAEREHVFVAGPEDLYGIRLADGEQVLHVNLGATELGSTQGLERHNDDVVVVGQGGVASYAMADGAQQFEVATERVVDHGLYGDRLALEVTAGGLAEFQEGGPDQLGLVGVDLNAGTLGELIVWEPSSNRVFGALEEGKAFISDDGRYAFVTGEDGRLTRYSL